MPKNFTCAVSGIVGFAELKSTVSYKSADAGASRASGEDPMLIKPARSDAHIYHASTDIREEESDKCRGGAMKHIPAIVRASGERGDNRREAGPPNAIALMDFFPRTRMKLGGSFAPDQLRSGVASPPSVWRGTPSQNNRYGEAHAGV
jgi:hypothetical protein